MSKNNFFSSKGILVLLMIFILLISQITGCQQKAAKKPAPTPEPAPPAPLAAEVVKYKEEPTISLYRQSTGKKDYLKLEEYIKGVVAAEIGDNYPMEALKAQAIIARTMTLALLEYENGTRLKHKTDASDNHTEFQAYDNKRVTDNIAQAVAATRGQVLTTKGKFTYALFHSVSKDQTASIEEAFPKLADKAPYIVPVATSGINLAPEKYRNWTVKVSKSEVLKAMGLSGTLTDIGVSKKGPSGRAVEISANQGKGKIAGVDFRQKIGFDRLYSTYITEMNIAGNYVVIKGCGWGHGAGMEQWGANAMAQEGKSAQEIVGHYFPKAIITQLYK